MMSLVTYCMYRCNTARSSLAHTEKSTSVYFPTVQSEKVANDGFLNRALHTAYLYKMPKRTSDIADLEAGASKSQATGQETARPQEVDEGMGEFEDRFEDDIESEEEIEEIERDAGE
jgi:hypothetical protein